MPVLFQAVSTQSEAPLTLLLSPLRAGRGELECTRLGSLFGDPDTVPQKVPLSLSKRERVRVRVRLDCKDTPQFAPFPSVQPVYNLQTSSNLSDRRSSLVQAVSDSVHESSRVKTATLSGGSLTRLRHFRLPPLCPQDKAKSPSG